jgi:hypothetical protein
MTGSISLSRRFFLLINILIFGCLITTAQTLELVPRVGFQYHGLVSSPDRPKSSEFKKSSPEFAALIGADIKFRSQTMVHIVSIDNIALGPSFSFYNTFADRGIIPTTGAHRAASSINHLLLSYGLERESKTKNRLQLFYALQAGIGFNKSQNVYDSVLAPDGFGTEIGTSYMKYTIKYSRVGLGIFLTGKAGITLLNKKKKDILNLYGYWHQGLKRMATYDIRYSYGYYDYPQYQRSDQVRLHSRGTVFGVSLGFPIRLIK